MCARVFRPDVKRSMSEIFRIHTIASNDSNKTPIMTLGSTSFFHVRHMNLYLVCATKTNVNAALVFEFLYRVISIGRSYFGKLDEEAVKNNFVLIYELLDGALMPAATPFFHVLIHGTCLLQRFSTLGILRTQRRIHSRCTSRQKASRANKQWSVAEPVRHEPRRELK